MTKKKANDRWFGDVKMLTSDVISNMLKAKGEPCRVNANDSVDKLDTSELWEVLRHCRDRCVFAPRWVRYFDTESLARIAFELGKRGMDREFRKQFQRGGKSPLNKDQRERRDREARSLYDAGCVTRKELAKRFCCSTRTVDRMLEKK